MKRFLIYLFLLLFCFTENSWAQSLTYHKNTRLRRVKILLAEVCKPNLVAGTGFLETTTSIAAYAGNDSSLTNWKIEVKDAEGDKAVGFLGAAGAGETLGTNLILSPNFAADTNWTKESGWTIAGGSGVGAAASSNIYQVVSPTVDALYKCGIEITARTGGTIANTFDGATIISAQSTVANYYGYRVVTTASSNWSILGATFTGTIDTARCWPVTDCAVTSLHVVATKNGSVRNWQSIDTNFNRNASSYTVTIFKGF